MTEVAAETAATVAVVLSVRTICCLASSKLAISLTPLPAVLIFVMRSLIVRAPFRDTLMVSPLRSVNLMSLVPAAAVATVSSPAAVPILLSRVSSAVSPAAVTLVSGATEEPLALARTVEAAAPSAVSFTSPPLMLLALRS